MKVITDKLTVSTKGFNDIIDITEQVQSILKKHQVKEGNVTIFVSGSTAGVTTIEYEPGLLKDLPEAFDRIAPMDKRYHHDSRWGDDNGYAHVRASILGASLTVPFSNGRLLVGTWQQIVLVDFDNRPRTRNIVVQIIGE
ncbi:secondary thiamine-phosphate synthase enzyme [Candidatus Kryptonium thompsonii]|uniref:Secondary thiamine-phosphate synthase enzyme n=1 Tax=Candidatus Kryptonium thompsonii TaxID=1633631 RepID=A0A0N7MTI5_9BACT|nr:secondary thiamine-phosphate synthase enzyme YjbQ [Candidatus Kryptonium thompsoni]CUS77203.1 secondary thiamine-phosphate synthase enzyme [Candidatus Kryptonium thompsoni]CUS79760.1 secondary thiamine-phosphate synthase enzyme [Candidatus Kryptonium thompsoni]CUS80014.1 secondary thiamine-phosphate synthase enzyme [Candidatus Kryptonium thompsoni]CUS81284.1 secondary thiamine-phosphate synthase enzyme [Candidatus Kryptonium thompsoni]CUS85169.1 secondary thiamine-phosphate synthase enzyme 